MSTELDLSRPPQGERAAAALVAVLTNSDDTAERHYLELKGPMDLTTKEAQAKLTKFILGAANRMPDVAAKAFNGYAVMVIGITNGSAPGIQPVEMLTLSQGIDLFLPLLPHRGTSPECRSPMARKSSSFLLILPRKDKRRLCANEMARRNCAAALST